VLAGGEGTRLRPLVRRVCGDDRPKQYAPLVGSRSLLRATLDRVAKAVPPERTVVVTVEGQRALAEAELGPPPRPWLLVQPADRGTAAAILWPVHWIHACDPEAVVAVFPSDHYVAAEAVFMRHVATVAQFVAHPAGSPPALLGAAPTRPERDYGWIEPGVPGGRVGAQPVWRVRRFVEKPSEEVARVCLARGFLWNTSVLVGQTEALIQLGVRLLPGLAGPLREAALRMEIEPGEVALRQAYAAATPADFSRHVLERWPWSFAVSRMPPVGWSDWGTPQRVADSLREAGVRPPWLDGVYEELARQSYAPESSTRPARGTLSAPLLRDRRAAYVRHH
jgi:mannose-1-phosphate guanylyltransferase